MAKITFFVMTYKGLAVLKSFVEKFGVNFINFVVCSRDNRTQNDYYDEIVSFCKDNQISIFDRNDTIPLLKEDEYFYAISWRWLIKDNNERLIVFHDSLLPRYRGFPPLVTYLINKEPYIGVTALFAHEK